MRPAPRLYVNFDLIADARQVLDDEQSNYLARVLRLKTDDAVRLFNGRDGEWRGALTVEDRRTVSVQLHEQTRAQPEPSARPVSLWFAPVKKARTDFIIEKATELGAVSIRPVITARTQSDRVRVDRLEKIALEAAEQTERLDLPDVQEPSSLASALQALPADTTLLFCDEAGDDTDAPWGGSDGRAGPIAGVIEKIPTQSAIVLIGPEGGFTSEERTMLRQMERVVPVTLGPRILRAETAALAAITVWQSVVGDWG